MKYVVLLFALALAGCPSPQVDGCTANDMKCGGDAVHICGSDQNWVVLADCGEMEPGTMVCEDNGEPECVEVFE